MRFTRRFSLIIGLILLGAVLPLGALAATPATAPAPAAAPAPVAQTVTLVNPSFENGFESSGVATGWASWVVDGSPTFQQITSSTDARRVKDGSNAQMMTVNDANYRGGLQQTVFGITAGQKYRFTIWAHAWASSGDDSTKSEGYTTINLKVGLGQGETHAADAGITWSELVHYVDNYQQLSVEFIAQSGALTIFTYANPAVHLKHNDVYWDLAQLTKITVAPTAIPATPAPTNTPLILPTDFTIPTANAQGQIIYIVQPGDSIVHIATVACGETMECVEKIRQLNNLSGNLITVGQQLIIGPLDGQPPPAGPATLTPAPAQAVTADPGATEPAATAAPAASPTGDNGPVAAEPTTPSLLAGDGDGGICITLYDDTNGNGILDAGETLVAGGVFNLLDVTGNILSTYTTNGISEPYCFENLVSATYRITSTVPESYQFTTRTDWDLTLAAGSIANVEFGAQFTGEGDGRGGDTGNGDTGGDDDPPLGGLLPAILGAAGVVLLLVAAGVAGFLFLTRRR